MRIGFFTDTYLPTPTGTSVTVENYRKALHARGHDVYVVAPEFPHYQDQSDAIIRIPSVFLPNRPESPIAKPVGGKQKQQILELELDIIHTFSLYNIGLCALDLSKHSHKPLVFTFDALYTEHTKNYRPIFKPMARIWYQRALRHYANSSQTVIVPTPSVKNLACQYGIVTPVEIVPAGINADDYTAITPSTLRTKFSIPEGQRVLLYVGRLDEESNVRFLLRAFREVWFKRENTHLLIIGRGPQEDLFQKIVKRQPFGDNVTFAGFMPKGELNKVYGAADVFVFPSTTATQALAVIEAMAAGLPPVAINRLGPSNIIRDDEDGYLTPLNEKQFSDKIIYLLENDKIRNHFGRIARDHAKKFSIEHSVENLLKIYQQLLK